MSALFSLPLSKRWLFAPKLWSLCVLLTTLALCLLAANWQGNRLAEKKARAALFLSGQSEAPLTALPPIVDEQLRYRPIQLTGKFTGEQWLLDNQIKNGRAGFAVLAVFDTGKERVMVNRGWQAMKSRADVAPQLDNKNMGLNARLNLPPKGLPALAPDPKTPQILPYLNFSVLPLSHLSPWLLEITAPVSETDSLERSLAPPDFKIATHQMYRGQWLLFAALALVLWVVLNTKKSSPGS